MQAVYPLHIYGYIQDALKSIVKILGKTPFGPLTAPLS